MVGWPRAGRLARGLGLVSHEWLAALGGDWASALSASLGYLPVAIPFALATVVGGIDCSESAAAAGDDYDTGQVIAVEGLATLVAALCGGVIQTTPYIGHPAYKTMGGRAAYTLATALFVGGAGIIGYFSTIYSLLPLAAVYPILVFIGLEITAQSFAATPQRHYPAVALACVPAMAYLVMIFVDNLLAETHAGLETLSLLFAQQLATLRLLGGRIRHHQPAVGLDLAALIDRRLSAAAAFLALAAVGSFFGVIHSVQPGTPIGLPWNLPGTDSARRRTCWPSLTAASAVMLLGWGWWVRGTSEIGTRIDGTLAMLQRVLETEVMDSADEARDYDAMDHVEVNRRFVADLLSTGPIAGEIARPGHWHGPNPDRTVPAGSGRPRAGDRPGPTHARTGRQEYSPRRADCANPHRTGRRQATALRRPCVRGSDLK